MSLLEDLESIQVSDSVRRIKCPVLILHGDADEIIPVEEAYELHACLSSAKRLSILPGSDHRLIRSDAHATGRHRSAGLANRACVS